MRTDLKPFVTLLLYLPLCAFQAEIDFGELQEPQPVKFSFETVGWKITAALLLIALLTGLFIWIKKRNKNKYRREALKNIERLPVEQQSIELWLITLKKMAITIFGRERVAPLHGLEWLSFLEKTGKDVELIKYNKPIMASIYKNQLPDNNTQKAIIQNAKQWIKTHAN